MVWRWGWVTRLSYGHVNLNKGTGKRGYCPMNTWKLPSPPPSNQSHFKLCDHFHLDNVFASPSKADVPWCLRNALWNIGIDVSEKWNKVAPFSTISPCMLLYKQVVGNLKHRWIFCEYFLLQLVNEAICNWLCYEADASSLWVELEQAAHCWFHSLSQYHTCTCHHLQQQGLSLCMMKMCEV